MAQKGHRGGNLSISINPMLANAAGGMPLFSPAPPTAGAHFRPNMPLPHPLSLNMNPLQTPMQSQFFPPPSPFIPGHTQRGSIVGLPAGLPFQPPNVIPGINAPMLPPNMINNQPMVHGGHGRSSSVSLPFNRNRRQPSISGGPPKAALGGPQNKHVAANVTNPATSAAALEKTIKGKKLVVKVPTEGVNEEGLVRDLTRYPVPLSELPEFEEPAPLDTTTGIIYPEEPRKDQLPRTLEVFLPGKDAWDVLKRKMIDEKLQKLGVEPSNAVPPIFAHNIHGRAASISSPADPNLLMFKLNKLHQFQSQSFSPNLSNSGLSVSPGPLGNRASSTSPQPNTTGTIPAGRFNLPGRHGHSMSMANPGSGAVLYPNGAFNPFGPSATLGSDQIISPAMSNGSGRGMPLPHEGTRTPDDATLHAPRGVPGRLGNNLTKLDFARGFGLDITEETEEELMEDEGSQAGASVSDFGGVSEVAAVLQEELDAIPEVDEPHSNAASRMHSRHVSRISAALSLRSLGRGGKSDSGILEEAEGEVEAEGGRAWESEGAVRTPDENKEWSDDESIGEYSNPSDEERARAARRAKKAQRKSKDKISQSSFGMLAVPAVPHVPQDSDDVISNPSEEERMYQGRSNGSRPLPAIPTSATHSRTGSGQPFTHSRSASGQILPHAIPLPHSRAQSGQYANGLGTPPSAPASATGSGFAINHRDSLNPNAKPFVFGKPYYSSTSAATPPTTAALPPATSTSYLNVAAPVFKPSIAAPEFKPSFTAKEFKPSPAAPEFKPKLPVMEFNPSGLTGAFKSNPGSGDFTAVTAITTAVEKSGETKTTVVASEPSFTFEPPSSAPKLSFPEPALEQPDQPVNAYGRAVQGREKRLRKDEESRDGSALRVAEVELKAPTPVGADSLTWNNLAAFKFPEDEEFVEEPEEVPDVKVNRSFVFPPPKKSTDTPTSRALPQLPTPPEATLKIPAPVQIAPETTSRARSPRPLPLTELPRRESGFAEQPASSAASSAAGNTFGSRALPQPPQRAQTMLSDFKPHSGTSNTVPASLFKKFAASNTNSPPVDGSHDDDTPLSNVRTHLKQKLSSMEIFEHNHRPSLDDMHMPMIARKVPRGEVERKEEKVVVTTEVITTKRRSSLPMPRSAAPSSLESDVESPLKKHFSIASQNVDKTLDDKLEALRRDLRLLIESHLTKVNTTTSNRAEEALMRIAHLMREQAADRQANPLPERVGQSAINSELIRNIVEDSNKEVCISVQRDLADFARHIQASVQRSPGDDILRTVEEQASRIITAVSGATMNLVSRLEAVHHMVEQPIGHNQAIAHNRVRSHEDLLRVLRPHLEEIRSAQFDVDTVTARLAEAVKPTLADFIDLASDKRETADLIVAKLAPVFNTLRENRSDTEVIATQLAAEIRRLIPSSDSHALTEQVADLVVERLDSKLAIRDRQLKPELTAEKVVEAIKPLVASIAFGDVAERLTKQEAHFATHEKHIEQLEQTLVRSVNGLPEKLRPILNQLTAAAASRSSVSMSHSATTTPVSHPSITAEALKAVLTAELESLNAKVTSGNEGISASQANLTEVAQQTQNMLDSGLNDLLHGQEMSVSHLQEILASHEKLLKQVSSLPEHLSSSGQALQATHSELLSKLRSLPDIVELQNQRHEMQVQLAKARSLHGTVRSEKDVLVEKMSNMEAERNRFRKELHVLQTSLADKEAEVSTSTSKISQLETALQQALSRVEASDATTAALKEQIVRMEGAQRELQKASNERQVKVDALELQLSFANRDKEAAQESLKRAEQERDVAAEQQQESWRESRMMSQKIDSLVQLLTSKENEELRELRKHKERSKGLEADLAGAKKRVADLESRVEGLVRSEAKATQSLEDSQRQLQDYEGRVERLEHEIEPLRRLDDAQRTRDREFEEIRLQLESQEKQEDSLRRLNTDLREELASVRAQLEMAQKAQATASWQQRQAKEPTAPAYARAAPTNGRASVLSGGGSSRSATPPAVNGVWASMHAPSTKSSKVPQGYQSVTRPSLQSSGRQATHSSAGYKRPVSPAQSVVSQAPTLREDGWWA